MTTQHTGTRFVSASHSHRKALAALVAMLFTSSLSLIGCGGKSESAPFPPAEQTTSAGSAAAPTAPDHETVKGTPDQEAAKQRAIQEGAAIQAANDPAAHPANDPNQGGK